MPHVVLGELVERLCHVHRRLSTRKGDKATVKQAIEVLAQMATRITELEEAEVKREEAQNSRIILVN